MRAMAEKICSGHAFKKSLDLLLRQPGSGFDGCPAGHCGKDVVKSVFAGHLPLLVAELFEHVEEQFTGPALAGETWNG